MKVLFARAPNDSGLAAEWMSGMSLEKRLRMRRMRREEDVLTSVTAHRLLCFALKTAFGIEPKPEDWAAGEYGKPYLRNINGIHFNISHSGNMAMCALHERPVGADIELVKPYRRGLEQKIMSESERQVYYRCTDKTKVLYQIWTLKESYLKYTGRGLGALREITIIPGEVINSNVPGCRFALIDSIPGYQSAVCAGTAEFSVECVGAGALNNF
jgi:4'-phosphopantetheinyl transferase